MKGKQGFLQGMDWDTAQNKRGPGTYYSMSNFRIITNEGLSSGSIETEKGTVLSFMVPDIPEMTLTNGDVIPAQTNLKIIGWTTIVDDIVVFTTNEDSDTPTNSYGQVWKLKYDEAIDAIPDLTPTGYLDTTIHLKYNNAVNFSTNYRIKAVGRYENVNTERVYWTDNYNPVRVLNLNDPDSIDIPLDNLNLKPGVTFTQPDIVSIGSGSLPAGAIVQFGYRLLDTGGAESLYSPLSTIVPLVSGDIYGPNQLDVQGTPPSVVNTRSVTYEINGIDTDFSVIEHIIVVYTDKDTKTIYKFKEQNVPSTGNLTITCDSITNATEIPFVEFNMLSSGFDICKDLDVTKNRLIAANTKTKNFDIDFDARAYRFNNAGNALLEDAGGNITLTTPGPNYASVPEDHDCINIYNRESDANWHTNNQYKYQEDKVTLGGTGLNISYKFTTQRITAGYTPALTSETHIVSSNFPDGYSDLTHNVLNADGTPKPIVVENQLVSPVSQWYNSNFTGYFRGETYRFGIVFFDKKGSPSFVKWIGDIRFPDVQDGYPIHNTIDGVNELLALGIEFTVDVTSIKDQISGYSIVRVERTEDDRTKLGTGMEMHAYDHVALEYSTLAHRWETTGPNSQPAADNNPYKIDKSVDVGGTTVDAVHLTDKPGLGWGNGAGDRDNIPIYILSPLGQIYNTTFKTGDYIETRGYYPAYCYCYEVNNSDPEDDRHYAFYYRTFGFLPNPYGLERWQLESTYLAEIGEYIPQGNFYPDINFVNAYASRSGALLGSNNRVPLGIGNKKLLLKLLNATPTINNANDFSTSVINYHGPTTNFTNWHGPVYNPDATDSIDFGTGYVTNHLVWFKEIVYGRYINNQYGGNTYEERSVNQYIETNHYQVINDNIPAILTFDVYGGDTHVNYYDEEQIEQYHSKSAIPAQPYKEPIVNKLGVATIFPCESLVNTNMRYGRTFARDRNASNMGAYQSNNYTVFDLYRQENNTFEKFFAEDFLLKITEEHPHQLWASEEKIDGELIDNWRSFKANNASEVTGIYGPINAIKNFKDRLYFYQNSAFGVASIDERSVIQDQTGQSLVLGTGGVFPAYEYISIITGTSHQFSVVASENAIYHYDARLQKVYRFAGQLEPISDTKRVSSLFDNLTNNLVNSVDKTVLRSSEATGVHTIYDPRYNRILFTFLNNIDYMLVGDNIYTITEKGKTVYYYQFLEGEYYYQAGNIYIVIQNTNIEFDPENPTTPNLANNNNFEVVKNGFTISFNESLNAFESFYDYVPELYLQYGRRLMSVDPNNVGKVYVHNVGPYGKYYEDDYCNSTIEFILSGNNDIVKVWNNIDYKAELYDSTGNDIFNQTFNKIRLYNDYQDTSLLNLAYSSSIIPATTGAIRRRMRTWNYTIPRNNGGNDRLRSPWLRLYLEFTNNANKRLIFHELEYNYTPSSY